MDIIFNWPARIFPVLDPVLRIVWYILLVYIAYPCLNMLFALARAIFVYLIAPLVYSPKLDHYKERWAVITGGTDGIGKAYTIELAKNGFKKFVLIGRNPSKLDTVREILEGQYNATVRTFIFDFDKGDYDGLRQFVESLDDIGFVLNSVGTGREKMERYGENPGADNAIFRVNGFGSAQFLSMVLGPMKRCGGGQIVCISSCLGFSPAANLAAYSATKTFINFICYCINEEYDNIHLQVLTPAVVATAMTYYKEGSKTTGLLDRLFVVTPAELARQALKTIGLVRVTSGTFAHEIELLICQMPWFVQKRVLEYTLQKEDRRVLEILEKQKQQKLSNGQSNGSGIGIIKESVN